MMKSKNILVPILSITLILVSLIFVSCTYDGSPTQNTLDLETLRLSKPKIHSENIIFEGDLEGSQEVVGCCPNAGPWPNYTMTLSEEVFPQEMTGEEHDGNIFMNRFGRNMDWAYKVQFWWGEGGDGYFYEYFIEIRGGVVHNDRKTKILTVTFVEVPSYEIWIGWVLQDIVTVSFILTRDPHHPATK